MSKVRWKSGTTMLALGLTLTVSFTGCAKKEQEAPLVVIEQDEEQTAYELVTVTVTDVENIEKIRCVYKQMNDQEISFSLDGKRVERVYVREGDAVSKGQLLATLSGDNLDSDIEELEYRVQRLELELAYLDENEALSISQRRVNQIFSGMSANADEDVSQIQQNYRYQREDKQDELEFTREKLEKLRKEKRAGSVYAGIDGTVYEIEDGLEGSTSQKDKVVITIIDSTECLFETNAGEYASYFQEGTPVSMKLSGGSSGVFELIPYHMDEWGDTQYFSIFTGPEDYSIGVDASGYIDLVVERAEQVLAIPRAAVHEANGESYVYVVGANNMREVRWVSTGLAGGSYVEITDGLAEGDKVILR